MTTPRSKDSSYTEGRIELAIQAFKKGQFQSLQAAALTYDAPITTVQRRDSQPSNRKLSSAKEETLIQWILPMDQRLSHVQQSLFVCNHIVFSHLVAMTKTPKTPSPLVLDTKLMGRIPFP
jgi:hypothetical protein